MKKAAVALLFFLSLWGSSAWAENYRFDLTISNTAIFGGLQAHRYNSKGYTKYGAGAFYVETDSKEYGLFDVNLMVGSETILPDLRCEIGFKGLLGKAEEGDHDSSLGAVAFSGIAAYRIPQQYSPIPVQFSLEIAGAPKMLSFIDGAGYFDLKTGVEVYIVENAAVQLNYRYHVLNFEDETWDLKDGRWMIGFILEF